MATSENDALSIDAVASLTLEEIDPFGAETLANFAHFVPFSSDATELFWVRVQRDGRLLAIVPVVRLKKRPATDMLNPPWNRVLRLLFGPLAKKTTLLVDTSFLAYDYVSPFFVLGDDTTRAVVRKKVVDFLKRQKRVDTVWISEPASEASWAPAEEFLCSYILPMVRIELSGIGNLDEYLASLSKKRRRNFRSQRRSFEGSGATIDVAEGPLSGDLGAAVYACLEQSAVRSAFHVPYNDVWTNRDAFLSQRQLVLIAKLGGRVVGFMSFLECEDRLLQCHGGLDYQASQPIHAYHNLIYRAIEYAISAGKRRLSMGPLNNETKRRGGTEELPVVGCLWNRYPLDRLVARTIFQKNFEVYRGPYPAVANPSPLQK